MPEGRQCALERTRAQVGGKGSGLGRTSLICLKRVRAQGRQRSLPHGSH
jgi:hypothetical protein